MKRLSEKGRASGRGCVAILSDPDVQHTPSHPFIVQETCHVHHPSSIRSSIGSRRRAAIGLPMVASSRVLGANEEIRMAIVGCGGRGGTHVAVRRAAGRPHRGGLRSRPPAAGVVRQKHRGEFRQPARRSGRRAAADGPQGLRRDLGGHDAVLARAAHDLGLRDRPPRVRRKAAGPFHLGRPPDGQRGPQVQPPGADRHPGPLAGHGPAGDRLHPLGAAGQDPVHRLLCQQGPDADRQTQRAAADPRNAGLRPVVRPGPQGTDLSRPHSVRLQLHLEHGRRRIVQPGRPRSRRRPLAAGRDRACRGA